MSQQGERSTDHEDDWWGQLYDDSTEDTGPTAAGDSLDDRFVSASGTVGASQADVVFGRESVSEEWDDLGAGAPPPLSPLPSRPAPPPAPAPSQDSPPAPARRSLGEGRTPEQPFSDTGPGVPPQRGGVPYGTGDVRRGSGPGRPSAPWEPPPAMPPGPATFPPGPKPPGFRDRTAASSADGVRNPIPSGAAWAGPPTEQPGDATPADTPHPQDGPRPDLPSLRTPTRRDIPAPPPEAPESSGTPASASAAATSALAVDGPPTSVDHVGSGPPTYAPEPTALPPADPDDLGDLVADTVLDGAHYGGCTLRAVSLRGDSARFRGEPRRDSLLTARFGTGEHALVLIAMATGARATPGAHRAAAEACQWIGRAVGLSHVRLAEDLRAARRGDLKSGLHRLTDRSLGKLRASAAEQGVRPEEYTAGLRCLLLPADPECRTRVFFGVGAGGLFRLRDGEWQDIEPRVAEVPAGEPVVGFGSPPHETPDGDRLTMDLGITTPPSPYEPAPEPPREPFRFRASVARPGDTLLLCTGGLAEPLRGEPELGEYLTRRWSGGTPPGLAAFLADTQVRVKGYADDRTAAAVWET